MITANSILSWGMVFCYVILNSLGAILIKHRINQLGIVNFDSFGTVVRYFFNLMTSCEVIFGFIAIFVGAITWMIALSRLELSIAYPLAIGSNFLIIVATSVILFAEPMTAYKIYGIVLILIGIYFISH